MYPLQSYSNFNEKKTEFGSYQKIDDKNVLLNFLNLLSKGDYIYRGINNASFKIYSSAQRHWLLKDSYYRNIGGKDFNDFINNAINIAKSDKVFINFFLNKNIPINDFLILSVLQHYINISPLLDFTLDINSALYFAIDNYTNPKNNSGLEDYISIYYIDNKLDWMKASIQAINISGVKQIEDLLSGLSKNDRYRISCDEVLKDTRNLTYDKYRDLGFIVVNGPDNGISLINSSILGFQCEYNITNPRIIQQKGKFILNPSDDIPLVEKINSYTGFQRIVNCVDIHKNLINEIEAHYLKPNLVCKDSIYPPSKDSKIIETIIRSKFEKNMFTRFKWKCKRLFI